jgi:hypothetical protein
MLTRQSEVVLKNFGLFKYGENLIRSSPLGVAEPNTEKTWFQIRLEPKPEH